MANSVLLPQCDASLLRRQILLLQKLRDEFLNETKSETVHELRVASRRFREMLRYVGKELPPKWLPQLTELCKEISKRLDRIRELETNGKLLNDFYVGGKAHAIAVELLLSGQNRRMIKAMRKAQQCLSNKRFERYKEFVSNLKGSLNLSPQHSDFLKAPTKEFLAFRWNIPLNDRRLHDLRTRTKKLRYAIEIQEKISRSKQGRLLAHIRKLQDLLGKIRDLIVFQEAVNRMRRGWEIRDLTLVPSSLAQLSENIFEEKNSLYGRVYPLFARIVPSLNFALHPPEPKAVRSSFSLHQDLSKTQNRKHSASKRLA
jgi:CHAD domain-containing protein